MKKALECAAYMYCIGISRLGILHSGLNFKCHVVPVFVQFLVGQGRARVTTIPGAMIHTRRIGQYVEGSKLFYHDY